MFVSFTTNDLSLILFILRLQSFFHGAPLVWSVRPCRSLDFPTNGETRCPQIFIISDIPEAFVHLHCLIYGVDKTDILQVLWVGFAVYILPISIMFIRYRYVLICGYIEISIRLNILLLNYRRLVFISNIVFDD